MSLRDTIIASGDKIAIEPIEAFGTTCYVRRMTAGDTGAFYQWQQHHPDHSGMDIMVQVLVRSLCDEQGNRQFSDDDADALLKLDPHDVSHTFEAASKLNQITDDDIEDAEKNSEATTTD